MQDKPAINLSEEIRTLLDRVQLQCVPVPKGVHSSRKAARQTSVAKRHRQMSEMYFGLDGKGGMSMESVGKATEYTRESVRQITNKFSELMSSDKQVPVPEFRRIAKKIKPNLPERTTDVFVSLVLDGSWSGEVDLSVLFAATNILLPEYSGKSDDKFITLTQGKQQFALLKSQKDWPKIVLSVANKLVSHNGAASVDQVVEEFSATVEARYQLKEERAQACNKKPPLPLPGSSVSKNFVRAVLDGEPFGVVWLEDNTWFTITTAKRNRVINRLDKIFHCYRQAKTLDVSLAIERSFKKNQKETTISLPLHILEALAALRPGFYVDNGTIGYKGRVISADVRPAERAVLSYMARSNDGVRREKEIEDSVMSLASSEDNANFSSISQYGFSMTLNFSPLIISVMQEENDGQLTRVRGRYRLVGELRETPEVYS